MTTLDSALRRERGRLQHHRWNMTFRAEEHGSWTGSMISAITMAKSVPHPLVSPNA
ncbi:hypothetical protein [Streptomyces anulatus]|uniref:hypothetical protein n=1 Tax=Streptomyces anulatus TaxID=1892 RepID=UPI0038667254